MDFITGCATPPFAAARQAIGGESGRLALGGYAGDAGCARIV